MPSEDHRILSALRARHMDGTYNIFQRLPNGDVTFLRAVEGPEAAQELLRKVAAETSAEIVAVDTRTNQVFARINARGHTRR